MPLLHATYKTTCIMSARGCAAKTLPKKVIMRNVGITASTRPLLAAWNSLNLENFFMIAVYYNFASKKSLIIVQELLSLFRCVGNSYSLKCSYPWKLISWRPVPLTRFTPCSATIRPMANMFLSVLLATNLRSCFSTAASVVKSSW